jgi:hypothetical protein
MNNFPISPPAPCRWKEVWELAAVVVKPLFRSPRGRRGESSTVRDKAPRDIESAELVRCRAPYLTT